MESSRWRLGRESSVYSSCDKSLPHSFGVSFFELPVGPLPFFSEHVTNDVFKNIAGNFINIYIICRT